MSNRLYREFPDSLIEEWCDRAQSGESKTSIAANPGGGLTSPVSRSYVSKLVRKVARPNAPGVKSPNDGPLALTPEERELLLQHVLNSQKHFGAGPSMRSLERCMGRSRANRALTRLAGRLTRWCERLLGYVEKGEPDTCHWWRGGTVRELRKDENGEPVSDFERFDKAVRQIVGKRITWNELVGKELSAAPAI